MTNKDHEPICTGCGIDSPLENTKEYGWICGDCISEFEHSESLDIEEYERRKRERLSEQQEY